MSDIANAVQRSPFATALYWSGSAGAASEQLSYSMLWCRASRGAAVLRRHVCMDTRRKGRETLVVCVMLEDGPSLAQVELSVMLAGLAVCPVDPEEPMARLAFIFEDAGPIALVGSNRSALARAREAARTNGHNKY